MNSRKHTAWILAALVVTMISVTGADANDSQPTVAEQIGGQIFIDTWGLVCPGDPQKAARYARKAASVSHDGDGIYGGQFVGGDIKPCGSQEEPVDVDIAALL